MPHINDLSVNNIFEGNNGEKWQVTDSLNSTDKMNIVLERLKVEEVIVHKLEEE